MASTSKRDYYEVLGISRDASADEVKRAFRRKARQYHPDANKEPGAPEMFKEANEAYEILSDPQKRAAYDRYGHAGVDPSARSDPFGGYASVSDIFGEFFGGAFRTTRSGSSTRSAPRRGQDIPYHITLDFAEAIFGTEKEIEFEQTVTCPTCKGTRAAPGTSPERCRTCSGTGEVRTVRQTFLGQMVNIATCPTCNGTGQTVPHPCPECRGRGQVRQMRKLKVTIPAGVDEGTQIRISGEGEPGAYGGPPGNLYLVISVRRDEKFLRRGDDLVVKLQINVAQAALGHTLNVPVLTPEGESETELNIPAGTGSGEVFTVKGMGVPRLRRDGTSAGRGNLEVMVEVNIPDKLTSRQRELFEELGETLGEAVIPPAHERNFFDRVFDWLGGD